MIGLLAASIAAASLNSVLLHKSAGKMDAVSFNLICSLVWIPVLFILNRCSVRLTSEALIWGILYGTVQMLFMLFKTKAMSSGPVSITTLIGNCSLVLSASAGVILWKEPVSRIQIAGIVLLLCSICCCTWTGSGQSKKADQTHSKFWPVYCAFFFFFAASVGIIFKAFSKTDSKDMNGMMLAAALTMLIFLLTARGRQCKKQKNCSESVTTKADTAEACGRNGRPWMDRSLLMLAAGSGLLSCIYNRLNISLAGVFPATIFYPSFNGGVILLSLVFSACMLKEKLTKKQVLGILLGTAAVVLIGLG